MPSRYNISSHIQPSRLVPPAITDDFHEFGIADRIDKLAFKYYKDATLGWIIMCANPKYFNELEIPIGDKIRIPLPLQRVWLYVAINGEDS